MNVTENNWLLPLEGEEPEVPFSVELGLKVRAGWEKAPVFNNMQKKFWPAYFNRYTAQELFRIGESLNLLKSKIPKSEMVKVLSDSYRGRFQ